MDYVQMTLDDWMSLKKEIKEEFIKASASFVRIGYLLRKAEDSEGYKNDGYDSLAEWARDELGLTATYVSRFKAINAKYSADGYSDHLLPEFVGYGSAKLGEMLALPDEDMEMLTPEMKRSDIRALKEFNRQEPEAPDAESWILEMMEIIPAEVKKDLAKECLQGALDGKKCSDILNPSGNSMKRTRAAMVAMTDEGLFVKTFGPDGGRRKISWQDFAQMLCERYEKWKPQETIAKPAEVPQAKEPKTGIPPSAVQEMSEDDVRTNEEAVEAMAILGEEHVEAVASMGTAEAREETDADVSRTDESIDHGATEGVDEALRADPEGTEDQPIEDQEDSVYPEGDADGQGEVPEDKPGGAPEADAAEGADQEEATAEGADPEGDKEERPAEDAGKESADIMPAPEEPVAPAQKPEESKTYQDAKAMMDGINAAFVRKDWDRMLGLLEGLEPAIRKLRREKWQES